MNESARPDVLLVMCDQLNPRMLGYAGDPLVRTPNVDALAREGVVFGNCYTTSPVCMPARCSFATGRYPHNHQVWGNVTGHQLPAADVSLFRAMRDAGYSTAQIGKFHYHLPEWGESFADYRDYYAAMALDWAQELPEPYHAPFFGSDYAAHLKRRGLWERFLADVAQRFQDGDHHVSPNPLPPDDQADAFVGQQAVAYVERCPTDRPMFLFVSFPGPHSPLDAPGEYAAMVDPAAVELAPNVPELTTQGGHQYGRDDVRAMQANYYGKIALIDAWVGRIVEAMRRRGSWDTAKVVFTADHGEFMGSHGRLAKGGFEEESARVPLVVRDPAIGSNVGAQRAAVVGHLDVFQTILDLAGATRPAQTFGQSLRPLLRGEGDAEPEAVFAEISTRGGFDYMVRRGRHKWFVQAGRERLYDLAADPYEQDDLAASPAHAPLRHEMRERLGRFLMETQLNRSAEYRPLFTRAGVAVGQADVAERMLGLFRRLGV